MGCAFLHACWRFARVVWSGSEPDVPEAEPPMRLGIVGGPHDGLEVTRGSPPHWVWIDHYTLRLSVESRPGTYLYRLERPLPGYDQHLKVYVFAARTHARCDECGAYHSLHADRPRCQLCGGHLTRSP